MSLCFEALRRSPRYRLRQQRFTTCCLGDLFSLVVSCIKQSAIVEQPRWTPLLVRGSEKLASDIPVHAIGNTTPGV